MLSHFRYPVKMAGSLPVECMVKQCFNCVYYRWGQPEDVLDIKQCGRCEKAFYCSKQCQQEHWHNIHKKHCKYLAKVRVFPKSKHEEASCLVCNEEAGLPCYMSSANMALMKIKVCTDNVMSPLAEMTGEFQSKTEATVTIMMRLLVKLRQTNHVVWRVDVERAEELYKTLYHLRRHCTVGH